MPFRVDVMKGRTAPLTERIALGVAIVGALAMIIGPFGAWGRAGSYTAPGLGSASDDALRLYPGLDEIGGLNAIAVLLAGVVALGALLAHALRATRSALPVVLVASAVGTLFAVLGLLEVTGAEVGFGGADPTWGVITALAGGLLAGVASALLLIRGSPGSAEP